MVVRSERFLCRECGRELVLVLPEDVQVSNPNCFTCRVCNGNKSMLDNMSKEDIAKIPLARELVRERERQRMRNPVYKRMVERERKFRQRNGFTLQEWHERVDGLGCACSFCRSELTKDPGKGNSVVRWSPDGSKSLEKTTPVCRACQCRKIGPLGPAR